MNFGELGAILDLLVPERHRAANAPAGTTTTRYTSLRVKRKKQ